MKKKLRAGLLCLPPPSVNLNRFTFECENIPMACGYLKSYAYASGLSEEAVIDIIPQSMMSLAGDSTLIEYLAWKNYDLLGFSLYQWNAIRSVHIMREIRKKNPSVRIVAGGPEVSAETDYLINEEIIDFMIAGEGEEPFRKLLVSLTNSQSSLEEIPGLIYREKNSLLSNPTGVAIKDISAIPSPNLSGFIELDFHRIYYMETMRGCIHKCKYCNWKLGGRQGISFFPVERIRQEFRLAREMGLRKVRILDGSVNISKEWLKTLCGIIIEENKDRYFSVRAFIDAETLDEECATLLYEANFSKIFLGLQSVSQETLKNIGRISNPENYLRGTSLLEKHNILYHTSIIIGLPGDTPDSFNATLEFLLKNNHGYVFLFPLSLSPNTHLRKEAKQFKLKYQKMPPNQVISTSTMSFYDIKKGIMLFRDKFSIHSDSGIYEKDRRYVKKNNCPENHLFYQKSFPSLVTYVEGKYPQQNINAAHERKCISIDILENIISSSNPSPITKLTFSKDFRKMKLGSINKFAWRISSMISWNTLLWLQDVGSKSDMNFLKELLSYLIQNNPNHIWHIVLDFKKEIPLKSIIEINAVLDRPPNIIDYELLYDRENQDDEYYKVKPFIIAVIPYESPQFSEKWIKELLNTIPVFWNLHFLKSYLNLPETGDGFLIDFSSDLLPSQILYILNSLNNSMNPKLFFFKNWIIQHLWSLKFGTNLKLWAGDENIIEFKDEKQIIHTAFSDNLLREHSMKWIESRKKTSYAGFSV